jgi:hypothetical protein
MRRAGGQHANAAVGLAMARPSPSAVRPPPSLAQPASRARLQGRSARWGQGSQQSGPRNCLISEPGCHISHLTGPSVISRNKYIIVKGPWPTDYAGRWATLGELLLQRPSLHQLEATIPHSLSPPISPWWLSAIRPPMRRSVIINGTGRRALKELLVVGGPFSHQTAGRSGRAASYYQIENHLDDLRARTPVHLT